jgi:hypothetical protein
MRCRTNGSRGRPAALAWIFAAALAVPVPSDATVIFDADGHVAGITDVPVTLSGTTTVYDVSYVHGTYEAVFGVAGDVLPAPYGLPFLTAAINAIANALDVGAPAGALYTNGMADGLGSNAGWVPGALGPHPLNNSTFTYCDWCVWVRGAYFTGSASLWSPDGANSYVRNGLTTQVLPAFVTGPTVTWAVFRAVPEPAPAALVLAGLGLAGCLAGWRAGAARSRGGARSLRARRRSAGRARRADHAMRRAPRPRRGR